MSRNTTDVTFDQIVNETDKAVCFRIVDDDVWLPKSQIEYEVTDGVTGSGNITLPEWLAEEKELI